MSLLLMSHASHLSPCISISHPLTLLLSLGMKLVMKEVAMTAKAALADATKSSSDLT